ncbi:hypothetical protein [Allopontixanthobacter sp.]|uniref:hypothetical protein n=1 Tax=Allopontixanthobacter sp. TaxID=2906452 RepID=UPI002ABB7DCF|nr:hypothetical protein [Allopontixanthobacter sp.]MDZ4307174.1 hypothetical protein [Allopontixanthobacter sp.]
MSDLQETREVAAKAREWIGSMLISGVARRSVSVAVISAAAESMMLADGVGPTSAFLRAQADLVDRTGPEFIEAARRAANGGK